MNKVNIFFSTISDTALKEKVLAAERIVPSLRGLRDFWILDRVVILPDFALVDSLSKKALAAAEWM